MTDDVLPSQALGKYLLQFTGAYVLLSAIVVAVTYFLNFDTPSAMGVITLIASASAPAQTFVKDHSRAMTKGERVRFASLGTLITLALTAVFTAAVMLYLFSDLQVAAVLMSQAMGDMPGWLLPALILFGAALTWVLLYFAMGFFTRGAARRLARHAER